MTRASIRRITEARPGGASALVATIALVAALAGCGGDDGDDTAADTGPSPSSPPQDLATATGAPLAEPEVISSADGVLEATLEVASTDVEIGGVPMVAQTYNGSYQPPTLRMRPGDHVEVTLVNSIDEGTNLHVHGLHVSPLNPGDNVLISIAAGETYVYEYDLPADHATGTFWYHSHEHTLSEAQVVSGMSGVIVVEGLTDLLPGPLQQVTERTLALKDLQLTDDGTIDTTTMDSNRSTTRLVNGQVQPVIAMAPGETQLWRLANIGADIFYRLSLGGTDFMVIAEDGNPVSATRQEEELVLAPGKRFDVLVQAPAEAEGELDLTTLAYDQGSDQYPEVVLASVELAGDPVGRDELPTTVGPFDDLADVDVDEEREFTFDGSDEDAAFTINGKEFSHDRVDTTVQLDAVEEWTLKNVTSEQHPFHIHINDFQVMSVDGEAFEAENLQDTVILPPEGEVVIRQRFADFTGKFVYHCHILWHEDAGMMAVVEVVDGG